MKRSGLGPKLTLLLLAFGVVPLAVAIVLGYRTSRATIVEQAELALQELTQQQAVHLATELQRERLLLRTIIGQLPRTPAGDKDQLAAALRQSLLEDGVFDGLRLIGADGRLLADVALWNTEPQWPDTAPAADWSATTVAIHREGTTVLAYVVGLGSMRGGGPPWLEGHVRASDFPHLFAVPSHLLGGAVVGVLEADGQPVLVPHARAGRQLAAAVAEGALDSAIVVRAPSGGERAMVALAPVPGIPWAVGAVLPLRIALAPVARMRNLAFLGMGVLVALLLVTGALAARSVTTPLRRLAGAAREYGRSGAYEPFASRTGDEIGSLVRSFNMMAEDLNRSRKEIDRLHALELERTHQLASVGELATGVAHEVRNPLTGVLGALELALKRIPTGDPSRELLEESERQLRRIELTTSQLLRYARPPELREVTVDANLVVDRARRVIDAQARTAGVSVTTELEEEPVPVRADPEQVVQVLVNLALNGIQAMREGGELVMDVKRDGTSVRLAVRDTGPGISADVRADIFRPFFTTKNQGTGLGLPISQQIIERHGGTLRPLDTPGGATFVVTLPVRGEESES